jgi:hypothetical protein
MKTGALTCRSKNYGSKRFFCFLALVNFRKGCGACRKNKVVKIRLKDMKPLRGLRE